MKIQKIASSGTIAINSVEISCDTPITLICAHNRGGKTSLRDGIIHAFTGEHPKERLKKNYSMLINRNNGNKVGYTYVDYDGNQRACITLPNGTHELTQPIPAVLPYVLDPSLFGNINPDARRSFLFDLMNLRSDGEAVKKNLVLRGLSTDRIEQVMPFLKSSFAAAQRHAEENVKQARANWKAVTGEVYGNNKAIDWKAPVPVVDLSAKEQTETDLAGIERALAEANQELGALQALANGAKQKAGEIQRLTELAGKEERIRQKLDIDRNSVDEWTLKIEETRKLAMGSKPGAIACTCPSCGTELVFDGAKLSERGGDLHGDEDAAAKLPEYENTLKMLKNAVTNGERDLSASTAAREQLALMNASEDAVPSEEKIEAVKNKVALLRASRDQAQRTLTKLNDDIRLAAEAEAKTKKAAEHHNDAQAWNAIADALAPDGIPGDMLGAALQPINDRIKQSVKRLGFSGNVRITDDMTILEDDGKLYAFSSKATRLLIDSMIAEAISFISGIKFFMIDEFDLLDLPTRGKYLKWLVGMAHIGEIDSVLVFGTLKERPTKLPVEITSYWLQDGVIVEHGAEVAA
jgi:DNA repair exonuclease SbcCD ATPase subunit